ncbi:MAG: polyphosphate--glucose phosphotransferase [Anaerolineales bacterium]|jgi:polyphosphate glucokinase
MKVLGIDIGGSGIKGAPVDTGTGILLKSRFRLPTPSPAKPEPVAKSVEKIADHFNWKGSLGIGFPGVVRKGTTLTAANIHEDWIGLDAAKYLKKRTGRKCCMINDADAAGLAEMAFGAGKNRQGVVLIVTIGTGLGTALFTDGHLLPNCELGHLEMRGADAEWYASDAARKRDKLSWKKWGQRFDQYLQTMEKLIWPDLIILGGGVSKKFQMYKPYLTVKAEVVPAQMRNEAGIVGAAVGACKYGN